MSADAERWRNRVVSGVQALADDMADTAPEAFLSDLQYVLDELPPTLAIVDQLMVRAVIGQALGRFVTSRSHSERTLVASALAAFMACGLTDSRWRRLVAADPCWPRLRDKGGTAPLVSRRHPLVERALTVIAARAADARLTLPCVAASIGVTPSHLSRLLTSYTGDGFAVHLHRRRVSQAYRALQDSRLSIKEIAAAVGYRSVTQLRRQFLRAHGVPPVALRVGGHAGAHAIRQGAPR
jgi:AraC-like DNA-binding protein